MDRDLDDVRTLDGTVALLRRTICSRFFCSCLAVCLAGLSGTWRDARVYAMMTWIGILSINVHLSTQARDIPESPAHKADISSRIDRLYSNAGSWLFLPSRLSWPEQTILVTGGGSGLGALLCSALAQKGATVISLDKIPSKEADPLDGQKIHRYICDVADWQAVDSIAREVIERHGQPTIIVNNAGIVKGRLLLDLSEGDVRDTFGANTLAHFWILKAFLPGMLKQGRGHVMTVASVLGILGASQSSDYCASKAAVISLHQTLRSELDFRYHCPQIRTSLILPSYISTALFARIQLPGHFPFSYVMPPLSPRTVVSAMVDTLESNESRVVRLPCYTQLARVWGPAVGLLPKWLEDGAKWVTGSEWAMREYGPGVDTSVETREK